MKKLCLLPLLFLLVFSSCNENNNDPAPELEVPPVENGNKPPCLLVKQVRGNSTIELEYDASGRLKTVDSGNYTSTYERNEEGNINKIVYKEGTEIKGYADIELDSQGRWGKITRSDNSIMTEIEYDSQGRISKSKMTIKIGEYTSYRYKTFEYKDGDLFRMTMTEDFTEVTEYEYYADKPAPDIEYDRIIAYGWGEASPAKLVKTKTTTRPNESYYSIIDNITYELNEKGYPTQITTHTTRRSLSGTPVEATSVVTRSYSCE